MQRIFNNMEVSTTQQRRDYTTQVNDYGLAYRSDGHAWDDTVTITHNRHIDHYSNGRRSMSEDWGYASTPHTIHNDFGRHGRPLQPQHFALNRDNWPPPILGDGPPPPFNGGHRFSHPSGRPLLNAHPSMQYHPPSVSTPPPCHPSVRPLHPHPHPSIRPQHHPHQVFDRPRGISLIGQHPTSYHNHYHYHQYYDNRRVDDRNWRPPVPRLNSFPIQHDHHHPNFSHYQRDRWYPPQR